MRARVRGKLREEVGDNLKQRGSERTQDKEATKIEKYLGEEAEERVGERKRETDTEIVKSKKVNSENWRERADTKMTRQKRK